jgi:hypothetical protein
MKKNDDDGDAVPLSKHGFLGEGTLSTELKLSACYQCWNGITIFNFW